MDKVFIRWTVKYGLELWVNDIEGNNKCIKCDNDLLNEIHIKTREYLKEEGLI